MNLQALNIIIIIIIIVIIVIVIVIVYDNDNDNINNNNNNNNNSFIEVSNVFIFCNELGPPSTKKVKLFTIKSIERCVGML